MEHGSSIGDLPVQTVTFHSSDPGGRGQALGVDVEKVETPMIYVEKPGNVVFHWDLQPTGIQTCIYIYIYLFTLW